jgi:nucleoside-diphosphate-sugar epimerase
LNFFPRSAEQRGIDAVMRSRNLVIGLSGQIGEAVLPRLLEHGDRILALSRNAQAPMAGVEWLDGSLQAMPPLPDDINCILSLGPLDAFVDWFIAAAPQLVRVVAISSTGRVDKLHSSDPAERELARILADAEDRLFATGTERGIAISILRPTLLYGSGRDQTISRLLKTARRWRWLPLPRSATGLRQPVHVADVADAVLRCRDAVGGSGQAYDLSGGEILRFDEMVRRTLARHAPGSRVVRVPTFLFRLAMRMAAWLGRAPIHPGMLERLRADQLADHSAATQAFGFKPRRFDP